MLAAAGLQDDDDPINRQPATLQALVLRAAPTDLRNLSIGAIAILMDRLLGTPQAPHPQLPQVLSEIVGWLDQHLPLRERQVGNRN